MAAWRRGRSRQSEPDDSEQVEVDVMRFGEFGSDPVAHRLLGDPAYDLAEQEPLGEGVVRKRLPGGRIGLRGQKGAAFVPVGIVSCSSGGRNSWSPARWVVTWRTVTSSFPAAANSGQCAAIGSSTDSTPRSWRSSTTSAATVLVMLHRLTIGRTPRSRSVDRRRSTPDVTDETSRCTTAALAPSSASSSKLVASADRTDRRSSASPLILGAIGHLRIRANGGDRNPDMRRPTPCLPGPARSPSGTTPAHPASRLSIVTSVSKSVAWSWRPPAPPSGFWRRATRRPITSTPTMWNSIAAGRSGGTYCE